MLSQLYEQRDKTITNLVKLGDCLGRSLRENVTLFSIDSSDTKVTYLTEAGKLIIGQYAIDKDVSLKNIKIVESSVYEDGEILDNMVSEKISNFVSNIFRDELREADASFDDVLGLWNSRARVSSVQKKLHEKTEKLAEIQSIVESQEFQNLLEILPQFQEFLEENFDKISTVPEIRNAVNLSNTVSLAFDFPKLGYEDLEEGSSYILKDGVSNSIYEMICRQELVKKELLESKKEFEAVWATNDKIQRLAQCIFEDDDAIVEALAEAIREVPFLALASKKSIRETFNRCIGDIEGVGISEVDIQEYASRIFEAKKDVKKELIETINEKYGVNVQNLQEPPSFKSLVNTQIVIFEALSRLAPNGSLLKSSLSELATSMKSKSGVQAIDVNSFIFEVFMACGYENVLEAQEPINEANKVNFKRLATDISDIGTLVSDLKKKVSSVDSQYESDESVDQKALADEEKAEKPQTKPGTSKAENPTPKKEEATPEEEAPEEEEDMLGGLEDLENMISDLASELGLDDEVDGEEADEEDTPVEKE